MIVKDIDFGKYPVGKVLSYYGTIGPCPKCKKRGAVVRWTEKQKTRKQYAERGEGRTIHKGEADSILFIPTEECVW